jgi:hypothetical protein
MNLYVNQTWDQLLQARLHPAALLQTAPDVIDGYMATAKELKEAIKMQLLHDTLFDKTETAIEVQVECYQLVSAVLINLFFEYQQEEAVTRKLKQFYQAVSAVFETIISWLQNNCGDYFNNELPLPLPLRFRKGWVLKRNWRVIVNKLNGAANNTSIVKILDRYVKEYLHTDNKICLTYHQGSYLQYLLKEIVDNFSRPVYSSLTELLIGCNFNEFDFMREICKGIWAELDNKESDELRLAWLKIKSKEVGQIPEKISVGFYPEQQPVKQTIFDWIEDEIVYWEEVGGG